MTHHNVWALWTLELNMECAATTHVDGKAARQPDFGRYGFAAMEVQMICCWLGLSHHQRAKSYGHYPHFR